MKSHIDFGRLCSVCLGFVLSLSGSLYAAPQSIVFSIATMMCGPDPHNITQALNNIPGVIEVKISLENKTANVSFDNEKASVDTMLTALAGAGYAALLPPKP